MKRECRTQEELDKAQADGVEDIWLVGDGYFILKSGRVVAWESSRVEAWGSSQVVARGSSQVVAWGSSQVVAWESSRVVAWGSSQVVARESSRVVAWGSSQVVARESSRVVAWESSRVVAWESSRVEAWGSSQVVARGSSRVEAWGYAQTQAWDASVIEAGKLCAITIHDKKVKAKGGVQIWAPPPTTVAEWCDLYGVPIKKGIVILFKAVRDNFHSYRGGDYTPGIIPKAPDWDGGKEECGGGYHFVPHPLMGLDFDSDATKFIACPIQLKDIVVHEQAQYPNKVKAPGGCAPCWEVDRDGKKK